MKKTLLILLGLCVLGSGSAWAFDGHVLKVDSNEVGVLYKAVSTTTVAGHSDAGHSDQDHAGSKSCDHCCHISAHIQAIFPHTTRFSSATPSAERLDYSEHVISCIVSPDLRPPRV